jgi:hypothetical protein
MHEENEIYKILFEKRERGLKNIIEGVNLFKVHCINLGNYHSEAPLYY